MRFCFLAPCLVLLANLLPPLASAQTPSSVLLRTFPVKAGKLLLDPVRLRLYATLPADNGVAVIDTGTNTLITTLPIGSNPVDLAISPDHSRLYVANNGSTTAGIGVVDLTTLTVLPSLPTPVEICAIAAGTDNRLYVLGPYGNGISLPGILQLDAVTGDIEAVFPSDGSVFAGYSGGFLQISPDCTRLFYGDTELSPSYLASFDVSTSTPTLASHYGFDSGGGVGLGLTISHNGKSLVYNDGGTNGNNVSLLSTDDVNDIIGTFQTGEGFGPVAFSIDDNELYQVSMESYFLSVYSTQTFGLLASFLLPAPDISTGYLASQPLQATSLAVTAPNGYLYVALTYIGDEGESIGNLLLFNTQPPPFFNGAATLSNGFFYLAFPNGTPFGYYNFDSAPLLYHSDLGFEYPYDAIDGSGIYFYDYISETFFYTSPTLFPYLYNFAEESFLYYYPDTQNPGHYTTNPRYFYNFANGQIIAL